MSEMLFKEEGTNKQAIANRLAIQSIKALARLGGYLAEPDLTPDNPIVKVTRSHTRQSYSQGNQIPHQTIL